jgi:uncharacterized membrane-anchored protein YitT (DUF2179 family)
MRFEDFKAFITHKLQHELSPELLYHSYGHTMDVYQAAEKYAAAEGVSGEDLTLLLTAALFHDAGFLVQADQHEEHSCHLAKEWLPQYGYSNVQIERICGMIRATRIPQEPHNLLEEILCDADLDYLGGDNYDAIAGHLHDEMRISGMLKSEEEWNNVQIRFMENHKFHTATAQRERNHGKAHNLWLVKTRAGIRSHPPTNLESHHKGWLSQRLKEAILVILGVISFAFALKGLLIPNNFFDGGVTGIGLLITKKYDLNIASVIVLVNIPFIIFGAYQVGMRFAIKTLLAMILLGLCLWFIPFPMVSDDKLIVSIFGGFFIGLGVGFGMHGGCALDGIEILASYTWKRMGFSLSEIIMGMNTIIFLVAAIYFGLEVAFYSMLTYYVATKTIDYVVEGIEEFTGVTIVSAGKSDEIKECLVEQLGKGITVYKGERGFMKGKFSDSSPVDIIYTVVTRLEVRKIRNALHAIDPKAFIFTSSIKEATGGILKQKARH